MSFEKVQSEKLAQPVVRQIELLILRGILTPGERLPSERELSERMGVSRPSLREAIAELVDKGLLVSKPGSGVYVEDALAPHFPEALTALFSRHEEAILDYITFRRDLEGISTERAATYGSDTDLKVIDTIFRKMEKAHVERKSAEEIDLDARFHTAITEAAHNTIMIHVMRAMFELQQFGVMFNRRTMFRQRITRENILDQHRAINDAIQARDPVAARAALNRHLDFVEKAMLAQQKAEQNEHVARQRYTRENER